MLRRSRTKNSISIVERAEEKVTSSLVFLGMKIEAATVIERVTELVSRDS